MKKLRHKTGFVQMGHICELAIVNIVTRLLFTTRYAKDAVKTKAQSRNVIKITVELEFYDVKFL